MKHNSILTSAFLTAVSAHALQPGDIAIVGWKDNGSPDEFAFVTLAPLAAGQNVYFTDNGYAYPTALGGFRGASATDGNGAEGLLKFTAVQNIAAGLIIRSTDTGSAFVWTSSGSVPGTSSGTFGALSLAAAGDQIYAFTGTDHNPLFNPEAFLFVLDDTGGFENSDDTQTGDLPPGITLGRDGVSFDQNGASQNVMSFKTESLFAGSKDEWLLAIANEGNWTFGSADGLPSGNLVVVAEPQTWMLAIVGGITALAMRPRRKP